MSAREDFGGYVKAGLESAQMEVGVDFADGLPSLFNVGLPDTAVQEARERVRTAIRNEGFVFPQKRVTVNLAPADVAKEDTGLDVAIAIGILVACGQLVAEELEAHTFSASWRWKRRCGIQTAFCPSCPMTSVWVCRPAG